MPIISSGPCERTKDDENEVLGDGEVRLVEKPLVQVVLYQPEIPQNTGNIARTCAATRTPLHLVEPLGFRITDRYLKRAGLDYWPHVDLKIHADMKALREELSTCRMVYLSAHASRAYYDFQFMPGDCLVFGQETRGLPRELLEADPECVLTIPIDRSRVRSLNLATTAGVVLFEALRQLMFQKDLPALPVRAGAKNDPAIRDGTC